MNSTNSTLIARLEGDWISAYSKASEAVARLDNTAKVGIVTGVGWQNGPCVGNTEPAPSIGFPSLCLQDGPLGLRFARNVTAFPAGIHAGSTWDKDLMRERGKAIGEEARALGVHVVLGPSGGPLGKIAHGGRNWEGKWRRIYVKLSVVFKLSSSESDRLTYSIRLWSRSISYRNRHVGNDYWASVCRRAGLCKGMFLEG